MRRLRGLLGLQNDVLCTSTAIYETHSTTTVVLSSVCYRLTPEIQVSHGQVPLTSFVLPIASPPLLTCIVVGIHQSCRYGSSNHNSSREDEQA